MPTSTTRLGYSQPLTTDAAAQLRESITANATLSDDNVTITSGVVSSRPTSSLVTGQTYYGTDTGLWYFYNGSAWETVMLAGAWVTISSGTFASGWTAASPVPRYRLEGDVVRLSGVIVNATGSTVTAPSAYGLMGSGAVPSPAAGRNLIVGAGSVAAPVMLEISNTGQVFISNGTVGNGAVMGLDGTYPLT